MVIVTAWAYFCFSTSCILWLPADFELLFCRKLCQKDHPILWCIASSTSFFYCNIQHKKWQSGVLVEWKICIIWSKTFVKIAWNCSFFWLSLMSCILEWIWMVFIFLHIVQKCPWFESENESNLKTLLLRLIFEIRNL